MKLEYFPQFFLQEICSRNKKLEYKDYEFFETIKNTNKLLRVALKPGKSYSDVEKPLKTLEASFQEWLNCLIIFYQLEFLHKKSTFVSFCKGMCNIVEFLVTPETSMPVTDKTKGPVSPKYPMPTETLYVISIKILMIV
jgi:hypothetical protein